MNRAIFVTASLVWLSIASLGAQQEPVDTISLSPTSVTFIWRVLQNDCAPLWVTNMGKVAITQITGALVAQTTSGLSLTSAGIIQPSSGNISVPPGRTEVLQVCPPRPALAGTYTGAVVLTIDGRKTERLPITVSSRGPTFGRLMWLPFGLFSLVLSIGLGVSYLLERWFTSGGLARAEAMIALAELAADLRDIRTQLARLGPPMPQTTTALDVLASEADSLRTSGRPPATLASEITRLTSGLQGARFAAAVLNAVVNDPVRLAAAAAAIDPLTLPRDEATLAAYRADAEKAIAAVVAAGFGPGAPAPAALAALEKERDTDPAVLRRRVARMALLQRSLIFLVAAFSAYATFYVNNTAFGSSLDYIGVFVWALGLTTAGAQIVTQARWPSRP